MASKMRGTTGLFCLMLLLPAHIVAALDCNLLKLGQERFNSQSLEMLKEVNTFTQECLENTTTFSLPTQISKIQQPELAARAVREILEGFLRILRSDLLKTDWEPTFRDRLLNMLHEQAERITGCLREKQMTLGRSPEAWKVRLTMRKYFQRITTFLKEKGPSATCAWESVRTEFWTSFIYIDMLTKRMNI